METIKPCPLCANKDIKAEFNIYAKHGIQMIVFKIWCEKCMLELIDMSGRNCQKRSIERWNRRANNDTGRSD